MGGISNLFATPTPTPAAVPISDGSALLNAWVTSSGSGSTGGDVFGPSSSIANSLAIFDGATGKLLKGIPGNGVVIGSGSGAISYFPFSQLPQPFTIPISDGSSKLDLWVTPSSGSGSVDIQTALDSISNVQGSILYRGSSLWQAMGPGVPGGFLTTNGSGADPTWSLGSGGGPFGNWVAAVDSVGGTYEPDSKQIAHDFVEALTGESYYSKIIWLLPMLGGNIQAARVPLIDVLGVGPSTNTNFVNGDFSQSTGLQGNGTSKVFDSLIHAGDLGSSNNGGLGYIENNISFAGSGVEPIGAYNTALSDRFVIDLRATLRAFRWGNAGNAAGDGSAAVNGHYYGQRLSATSRELFLNGASLGANTTNDTTSGSLDNNILLMGVNAGGLSYWAGRCSCAYMTDGTMSGAEVTAFHSFLQTWLLTPTGR